MKHEDEAEPAPQHHHYYQAPTADMVNVFRDMKHKAKMEVISEVAVETNIVSGVVVTMQHDMPDARYVAVVVFRLNDVRYEIMTDISRQQTVMNVEGATSFLIRAVSNKIAESLATELQAAQAR